jgi:hypothetical protein
MIDTAAPAPAAEAALIETAGAPVPLPTPAVETPTSAADEAELELAGPDEEGELVEADIEIELPEKLYELRTSPQRMLYAPGVEHRDSFKDTDLVGVPAELQAVVGQEIREVLTDLALTGSESKELVADYRAAVRNADPAPTKAVVHDAIIEKLNSEFGYSATTALKAAQALIARDPRLADIVNKLPDGPKTAQIIATIARGAMRQRSKL